MHAPLWMVTKIKSFQMGFSSPTTAYNRYSLLGEK